MKAKQEEVEIKINLSLSLEELKALETLSDLICTNDIDRIAGVRRSDAVTLVNLLNILSDS